MITVDPFQRSSLKAHSDVQLLPRFPTEIWIEGKVSQLSIDLWPEQARRKKNQKNKEQMKAYLQESDWKSWMTTDDWNAMIVCEVGLVFFDDLDLIFQT